MDATLNRFYRIEGPAHVRSEAAEVSRRHYAALETHPAKVVELLHFAAHMAWLFGTLATRDDLDDVSRQKARDTEARAQALLRDCGL